MIGTVRQFFRLFTRPQAARPVIWSVVSRLPVYLVSLALILVVREQGGGYPEAGLVSALYTVGMALGSPLIARRMDRTGPRAVLLTTGLTYPAALTALVWGTGPASPAQLALAVLAGIALPPANAFMRTLWARLPLTDEERDTAYLWEATLTELLIVGAPLIFAGVMVVGSAAEALTVVAAVGGAGAIGLAFTPFTRAGSDDASPASRQAPRRVWGPLANRDVQAVILVVGVASVPIGLMTLAIPALVGEFGSPDATGVVYACWGVGSAVGALSLGRMQSAQPAHERFPRLLLMYAVGAALPVAATSELTLGLALAVGGAPIALVSACEMTLVSRLADPQQQAETFTWVALATVTGDAVGQQTAGLLVDPLGARTVFPVAAGLCLAAMAMAFAFRGRFAHPTSPHVHAN
ncbi:MFS transporter [Streptomyces thermoalcalitolerans]|uniref:MFS transporter n=1 Tax=Streptomyces thermoalcalitolerans TaxID=65605 RepID=A0ABP3YT52_9ACTN